MGWEKCVGWVLQLGVAVGTIGLAWMAYQQVRWMSEQTDLLREERELAMRPNLFLSPHGLFFGSGPIRKGGEPDSTDFPANSVYFLLLNMSIHPVTYLSGFVYAWSPGKPFPKEPGVEEGRITALNFSSASGDYERTTLRTGEHGWLTPVEGEKLYNLFPRETGREQTLLVSLAVLYPPAPGGIAVLHVPVVIRNVGEQNLVGWADIKAAAVEYPLRKGKAPNQP